MTDAPKNLLDVRALLQQNTGLAATALGITGDPAHVGGYHCGSDRVKRDGKTIRDYSVNESSRDSSALTLDACALDVGAFTIKSGGKTYDLDHFNTWLIGQCKAGAADTKDIREVIYRVDSKTVKRWDRLGKRTTGDSSHLWHTHISFHRDAIKAGKDLTPLFRRYLTSIGLIKGDDDMTPDEVRTQVALGIYDALYVAASGNDFRGLTYSGKTGSVGSSIRSNLAAIVKLGANPDPDAIVKGVLAGLSPEVIAAAIPPELARQVADELGRRLKA